MSSNVAVYGGNGALGRCLVNFFKAKDFGVTSIDLVENEAADQNVIIKNLSSWADQHQEVVDGLSEALGEKKLDALFCVAGGWAGGNASSANYIKNCDLMWKQSVWSSSIAGSLASKFLKPQGLLTLTGAAPATGATSGMIGYGMAKAAVHQLCKSLASDTSGLPEKACTVCITPITLDTPMNRKNMPKADFASWTPLEFVAQLFLNWTNDENRPENGSLVKLKTEKGETSTIAI